MSKGKLTPHRQDLVDRLLKNIEEGAGIWKQGWTSMGAPRSLITGKRYKGVNNLCLALTAIDKGYQDNRWVTYNQIEENGWKFKVDEEGKSLGKDAGVKVEFFGLLDKKTNKTLDRAKLLAMSDQEMNAYIKENVRSVRKTYVVFNAELIDGVPKLEPLNEIETVKEAEELSKFWNEKEVKILHDADCAYYDMKHDKIHLPQKKQFESTYEYYLTLFHELAHSTAHKSRMNRELTKDEENYAVEELRAEIASIFLGQEFKVPYSKAGFENNASYINAWKETLNEHPEALFTAIQDADKITEYVVDKKHKNDLLKEPFYYAKEEFVASNGTKFLTYFYISGVGNVEFINKYPYPEDKLKELDNLLGLQKEKDKNEGLVSCVSYLELEDIAKKKKVELKDLYIKPSEIAKRAIMEKNKLKHGPEALKYVGDLEIFRKAYNGKNGDLFRKYFNGENILQTREQNDRALMGRIVMACDNKDYEQMVRIFKASYRYYGDYEDNYYLNMAKKAKSLIDSRKIPESKSRKENIINKQNEETK